MDSRTIGTDTLLGARLVERVGLRALRPMVRVLAYHDVTDGVAFDAQMAHLARNYQPVDGAQVAAAARSGAGLPDRAVWVTFDDGYRSVVETGLPILERHGIPATLYICPGLLDEDRFWWEVVAQALAAHPEGLEHGGHTWHDRSLITHLKQVPDAERRAAVDSWRSIPAAVQSDGPLDPGHARTWLASGRELGNHTLDHPCLDRCDLAEQRRQITEAHERLTDLIGTPPTSFAYPNGDWTLDAEAVLQDLEYQTAGLFDHALAQPGQDPLRISRLRIDGAKPVSRLRAVASGVHAKLFHARRAA